MSEPATDTPQDVPSPCIRHCCLDDQDVCLGCGRTLADILRWHDASPEERRQIVEMARQRLAQRPAWS